MGIRIVSDSNSSSVGNQNHSCCYSGLSEFFDEDMDELLNASQDSIRNELMTYGYDPDQLVRDLLIDLNPKVDRIPVKKPQNKKHHINYFLEAFSVIQESVLESLLRTVPKQPFWKRWPVFSGALAFTFLLIISLSFSFFSIKNNSSAHEVIADNKEKNVSTSSRVGSTPNVIATTSEENKLNLDIGHEEPYKLASAKTIKMLDQLSESEIKSFNKLISAYVKNGGKIKPTDDSIKFIKTLTDEFNEKPQLLKASLGKKGVFCSDTGFYSHIIEKNETLISVANNCGFKSSNLNTAKNVPILQETDVVHFNFDQNRNLTKITVYQNDSFDILDFKQGRFIEKELLDEEHSVIVEIDLSKNLSIYEGLKTSGDLKSKKDLWKKVSEKLVRDYSDRLVMTKISNNTKYYVNIKYRHNTIRDNYDVVSASLLEDRYGN